MDTALAIALIGASVSVMGWVINHALNTSSDRTRERLNFQLDYTKQQLEQLYGPLAFLILEGRRSFNDLLLTGLWQKVILCEPALTRQ